MSISPKSIRYQDENRLNPPPKLPVKKKSDKEFFRIIREINRLSGGFRNRNATIGIWGDDGKLHNRQKVLISLRWLLKNLTIHRHELGKMPPRRNAAKSKYDEE